MDRRTVRDLIERLNRDAGWISRRFGLQYKSVTEIKIRLRHAVTGKPLKYSSLVNTLCHELAHLRYFHHGERFKSFYLQILEFARAQRIYRPGRPAEGAALRSPAPPPAQDEPRPPRLRKTSRGRRDRFSWGCSDGPHC
jgi:hypothetical protein